MIQDYESEDEAITDIVTCVSVTWRTFKRETMTNQTYIVL